MQTVRLAAFVSGAGLQLVLPSGSHSRGGTPLHPEDRFSRLHWQDDIESSQWLELLHPFTAVKDLYISREFAAYRARPARARRGKSDRSVTRPADSFLGGATPIGTCPGSHWAVCCRTTACRSPHCRFSLGNRFRARSSSNVSATKFAANENWLSDEAIS
jgi:hypothetical protein